MSPDLALALIAGALCVALAWMVVLGACAAVARGDRVQRQHFAELRRQRAEARS